MKSKVNEYGITLLHKYKVEHTEAVSRLLSSLFYYKLQEHLLR